MAILVLGGAGYIGSHAVDQLLNKGFKTIAVDNLQTGHRKAVHEKAVFTMEISVKNRFFALCLRRRT